MRGVRDEDDVIHPVCALSACMVIGSALGVIGS